MSAIFLSHSSRDDAAAAELRERLAEQGHHSVFLDFDPAVGIPAGRDWERELYLRLRACQAVIVLCSEHSMASRWCFVEITHAKAFGKHIFPLKIDDCAIDPVLTSRQVLDLTADPEDAYHRLWRGLEVAGLDPKDAFDWDGTRPPYPGLLAFQEDDAAIFFGRDREIHRGLESLNRMLRFGGARAMLVLGASGSGKSSLVRAGLLPRLRRNLEEWLVVAPFRPLGRPLRELARALAETASRHGHQLGWRPIHNRLQDADDAAAGGEVLNELARDLRAAAGQPRATVLLVIDQAEELLSDREGELFLPLLRAALEADDSVVMAVLTLRSDLLGAFQKDPAARGFEVEDLRVGPIAAEGVAQIIEGPARIAGLDLEPGLTQAMVDDTEADGSLPLLAFALRELYELYRRRGRGDQLEVADYRETLGGLAGSVARAAESVYAAGALSDAQQEELRHAFLALARINKEGRYVRQAASWETLPTAAYEVLERFVAARLLIFRDEGGDRILEVAHEAIFRSWRRLKDWLDEDREFFLWRRRLETACREWRRLERHASGLLQGPALPEARSWLRREGERLREDEKELIVASVAAALRQRRRRMALLAATAIFLATVATGGIALWRHAESQRARAADLGRVSLAGDWLDEDPTRAALALLDLENPAEVGIATALMSEALQQTLAFVELRGHQGGLPVARFDDTGDRLVTASSDGTAAVWSVEGTRLASLQGHGDRLTSASFSADGEHVVTASSDGTARVWRLDGVTLAVLEGHGDRLTSASFSADGERVVTASEDATARVWRLGGEGEPIVLAGHDAGLTSASFSADGEWVVTASKDTTARIWPADGVGEPIVLSGHEGAVSAASFSADGGRVVTASSDGTARVWGLDGGEPIVLSGHDDALTAASFDRSGLLVVTASEDATARLWRLDGEAEPLILAGHEDALTAAAFNRKGDRVVTASEDETARVWTTDREGELLVLRGHRSAVVHTAFSPDGLRIVTSSLDGTARLWETAGESESAVVLEDQENQIVTARFSPDGKHVVTGLQDHSIWVWNADGSCPMRLGAHEDTIRSLAWNAAGDRLVSAAEDGAVRVWHADGVGEPVTLPETDHKVTAAALSPLGNRVAIASEDGEVRVWFAGGVGEPVVLAAHKDAIESVAFSPDGERIVTASQDQTARIHDVDGGGTSVVLGPHHGWVTSAAFDPLGERVVTVSTDRRTRVWRADGNGKPVVLNEHSVAAGTATFGPRGERIATVRHGDTVRIWNADGSGRSLILEGDDQEILALVFDESGERLSTVAEDGRLVESLLSVDLLLRSITEATRVCLRPEERERSFSESPEEALRSYEECESSYGRVPVR